MTFSKYLGSFAILGSLSLSVPAWADIPADNECFAASVGKPCHNAISDEGSFQPGTCKEAMCTRATPDGSMTYACFRCEPLDDGRGGQANEGGTGGGGETSGGSAGTATNPGGGSSAGGTSSGGADAGTAGTKAGSSGAAADPKSSSDDDGGCSMSYPHRGGGALGAALIALGFAVAGLRRRRSAAS